MSFSPIDRLSRHFTLPLEDPGCIPSLLEVLESVPDPRRAHGRRHSLAFVLAITVMAVLCGAKSIAAIAQWAREAPSQVLADLGAGRVRRTGRLRIPVASTVTRVLARVDGDALDDAICAWLATLASDATDDGAPRAVAVDGETLRGAKDSTVISRTCCQRSPTTASRSPSGKWTARPTRSPRPPRCSNASSCPGAS